MKIIENQSKFARPCAQGVLDPLISLVPSVVLVPSINLDNEHPGGHRPRKCGPRWVLGASLVPPWGILVGGRYFFLMRRPN